MLPILTLTLNPAVDISTSAPEISPGPKLRCSPPHYDPGGGGINVSRAIRFLGGDSLALVATGGPNGSRLLSLLAAEGVQVAGVELPSETRSSLSVTDQHSGKQFRFVLPGPVWTEVELATFEALVTTRLSPGAIVVLSGSLPPGVPDDWPVRLAGLAHAAGALLIVDTSGGPLRRFAAAGSGVFLLRMDDTEAEDLAGRPLLTATESLAFAQELIAAGAAQAVIIARGAEGSVLAHAGGAHVAGCPMDHVTSAVGAGDSFVAGLSLALSRHDDMAEALRHGTAAAAAAVLTEATELCRAEDYTRLLGTTRLDKIG